MAVQERAALTVVVDTNVIVAALLQDGIVRELILSNPGAFVTSEANIGEIWEHAAEWERRGLPLRVLRRAVGLLVADFIAVLPRSAYHTHEVEAQRLVPDPDDVPVVALGLAVESEGIWTFNTRDFSNPALRSRIRILTTQDVADLLERDELEQC